MRVPAVLFALLLLTAGCSTLTGGTDRAPSDPRALDVRNQTVAAVENVSTYRYDVDADVTATDGDERRSVGIAGEGAVSRPDRLLAANTTTTDQTQSAYLVDRKSYTQCPEPWGGWSVRNASESADWFDLTPLGRQVTVLERSHVYYRGTDTVDGNETALVVAYPTVDTLQSLPDSPTTSSSDLTQENVDNVTYRMWVDPDSGHPVATEFDIEVSKGSASATAVLRTEFDAYDEPADITVPDISADERRELGCPGT